MVLFVMMLMPCFAVAAETEANLVAEISFQAKKAYADSFKDVTLDVVFTDPEGAQKTVPAFWAGGNQWKVRYASPLTGTHRYRSNCSAKDDPGLHGVEGRIEIKPYTGKNPLYRHGPIQVAADRRHFEHADGTPFFWLGDTWWKGLCKRLTWEGFQELMADRKTKGFTVVQIVCGLHPDEGLFEPRWENEGGKPYLTRDFSVVNPKYFEYADRHIEWLIDAGILPAIVGGWARDWGMPAVGDAGWKRHWRNLIAHYGAYPTTWLFAGEAGGWAFKGTEKQWTDVAMYARKTDPYGRLATMHTPGSSRTGVIDQSVIHYDMLQTSHCDWDAVRMSISAIKESYSATPTMPTVVGEACYEGHMQLNHPDIQRHLFWGCMLNGAAGHTYGAAGIWHAGVEGDPGITPVYDLTTGART